MLFAFAGGSLRQFVQGKAVLFKGQQALIPHLAQLLGEGAAVQIEVVGQLLPVERDVEHIHPRMHGFGGKLEQKALPNGVRGDVADFLGHH